MRVIKSLFLFGVLVSTFLLLNIDFSSAADLCDVVAESSCTGQVVMRLSGETNAHGALKVGQSNFPGNKVLCCNFGGGVTTSCDANKKFLGLSSTGNAHGQEPEFSTYPSEACYDSFNGCRATTGDCTTTGPLSGREIEVLRLSGTSSNFHIAEREILPSVSAYSNKICCKVIIPQETINVLSPDGGETWTFDSQQTITWQGSSGIANVKISISHDGLDGAYEDIISSTPNDGSHPWTVTGPATANAAIRIRDVDSSVEGKSDAIFTISESAGPTPECTIDADCSPGFSCIDGTCQQVENPVGCYTDAYWEKSGAKVTGTNKDDIFIAGDITTMVVEGTGCVEASFAVKDNSNDGTAGQKFAGFSGNTAEGTWDATYNAASGYSKYYFTAQQFSPNPYASISTKSAGHTGASLIKVFKSEGVFACPGYTTDGSEVCNDDPLDVAIGHNGCSWTGTECVDPGEEFIDPETGETFHCSYKQIVTDDCEDGFLSYTMQASWDGEEGEKKLACEAKTKNVTVECPAQIALPFFDMNTLVMAIA